MHKYTGIEKFNPKSFKSGSSVGFIDQNTAPYEVLFAQIRMLRELMFDVIPLSRYDHLVRNGSSKVWSTTAPAQQHEDTEPHLVDEAGMKKWSNGMLKGHPGGRASTWEQWGKNLEEKLTSLMMHDNKVKKT